MKKITPIRAGLLNRIGRRRWIRSLLRRRKYIKTHLEQAGQDAPDYYYIKAPDVVEVYDADGKADHFNKTVKFLQAVESGFHKDNAVLDFRKTKHVSAAALLMLYATIESCKRTTRSKILYPKKYERVKKVLHIANIDRLVQKSAISYNTLAEKEHIPVVSSRGAEYQEEIVDHIQKRIYSDKLDPELEHKYGDAVSETINNVQMHAYTMGGSGGPWWLLCSVVGKRLYLAIYDLGVGIPKTVVERAWINDMISKVYPSIYLGNTAAERKINISKSGVTDKELISYSMMADVSGTKSQKHGQGSKSIKALVESFSDGKLLIFSGKGLYKMTGDDCKIELFDLPIPVKGTLIQWSMDLL